MAVSGVKTCGQLLHTVEEIKATIKQMKPGKTQELDESHPRCTITEGSLYLISCKVNPSHAENNAVY